MCSVEEAEGGATTRKLMGYLHEEGGRTSNSSGAKPTRSDVVVVPIVLLVDNSEANPRVPCHCASGQAHCFFAPWRLQSIVEKAQDP
jgi:hypothetical protein